MKIFIIVVMAWILVILWTDDAHLVKAAICGGIYFLAEISFVLKKLLEQSNREAEQTRRTLEAIGLDLVQNLKDKN